MAVGHEKLELHITVLGVQQGGVGKPDEMLLVSLPRSVSHSHLLVLVHLEAEVEELVSDHLGGHELVLLRHTGMLRVEGGDDCVWGVIDVE